MTIAGRLAATPGGRPRSPGRPAPVTVECEQDRVMIRVRTPGAALALWRTRRRLRPLALAAVKAGLRQAFKLGPLPAIPVRAY